MIRKLKIKFIITNMLLITLVIFTAFIVLYYNTAKDLEKSSIAAMQDIANSDRSSIDGLFDKDKENRNKYPNLSTYILDIDTRTNTCYIDGFGDVDSLTDDNIEYINELIHLVQATGTEDGIIEKHNMRFYQTEKLYGTRIVLLDKQYEDDSLNKMMFYCSLIGGITLLAFLGISILIAHIAVKPIEKSINQQKQLVSDMSHELKTPITVVATNTDIILSHPESTVDEEKKWLGYIKDETSRMTQLVNMMLFLAKTDEAEAKPILTEVDFSSITLEMALPFESICFEKEKQFSFSVEEDVLIKGEETPLKQLLVILLDNAVKYSNDNGRIEITLQKQADKAVLSVFNTGEPIPKDHIPFIFERFYRVDKARSRESGGSGLGLSIAKRIIENNEGTISVTSNQENGTVFTCAFKLLKTKR